MTGEAGDVDISFDEDNRIRVLHSEKFKMTENLETECQSFTEKIANFGNTVQTLVDILDGQAQKIEQEKLMAIGMRNKVDMEADSRRRRQLQMEALITDKMAELERVTFNQNSLEKVEREQLALIEKLSKNEM